MSRRCITSCAMCRPWRTGRWPPCHGCSIRQRPGASRRREATRAVFWSSTRSAGRERFLTEEEFRRLGRLLSEAAAEGGVSAQAAAAIRLLMLTGCRRNEILTLRWEDVDLDEGELHLRGRQDRAAGGSSVAGRGDACCWPAARSRQSVGLSRQETGYLSNECRRSLASGEGARRAGWTCGFMICGTALRAGALALGESLPMIGKLLGHSQVENHGPLRPSGAGLDAGIGGEDCRQHRGRPSECQYQTYALYELKKFVLNQYGVICADQTRLKPGARSRPLHCH